MNIIVTFYCHEMLNKKYSYNIKISLLLLQCLYHLFIFISNQIVAWRAKDEISFNS